MKFTIAIEPGTRKTAFGVVVPDLPGCFSAGDTVEEAFDNVREAIEAHCELLAERMGELPAGGDALAVIGVVFLVLIILELVGVIDIFKKFP